MPEDKFKIEVDSSSNDKDSKLAGRIVNDLKLAYAAKSKLLKKMEQDTELALGFQLSDADRYDLESQGVLPIEINLIRPMLQFLSGTQRNNKTDFIAFPEGKEDSQEAEVATRLLKNLMKQTEGEEKLTEQFDEGCMIGESWVEPYIDYTYDLVNGEMNLKKETPFEVFEDPTSKEYDGSDGRYMIKYLPDLLDDQIIELFPDKKEVIKDAPTGKLSFDNVGDTDSMGMHIQKEDYGKEPNDIITPTKGKDLTYYYYKKLKTKYIVVDLATDEIDEMDNKAEALEKASTLIGGDLLREKEVNIVEREVPEIWEAVLLGTSEILQDELSWTYPRWKKYPIIPYRGYWTRTYVKSTHRDLLTQGVVRPLRGLQLELNKARTLALRHLNQSANSGWLCEEDTWKDPDLVAEYGSTPGVTLEYKKGKTAPARLFPEQLSIGHTKIAEEANKNIKEVSGMNPDLLALQEGGTDSGRAIRLRTQQGMVMINQLLDNLNRTKKLLGKFLTAMLGEVYSLESAKKVLGEAYITKTFGKPVMAENPATGEPVQQGIEIDEAAVDSTILSVLNSKVTQKYNIDIGLSNDSETALTLSFMELLSLAKEGVAIPASTLVEYSNIPNSAKQAVMEANKQAQGQQR